MEKNFAGPGVKVVSSSAVSSQVGCPHDETLLRRFLVRLSCHFGPPTVGRPECRRRERRPHRRIVLPRIRSLDPPRSVKLL